MGGVGGEGGNEYVVGGGSHTKFTKVHQIH